ncbi:MAG TPA: ABC transporter ATP-binding protein [Acidimicrobiia bacterium]|nr:ABC transporter ATP-binding protein [Acidimicrobiia bacterium]
MALLEVRDLHRSFGGLKAVNGAGFDVEAGSITALIGPNGAGKTTAFNMVSGVLRPDQGSIRLDGVELTKLAPHQITARGLSRTFQITRGLARLTVLENMVAAAPPRGFWELFASKVAKREAARAMELLEFVGIDHLADAGAEDLSYGQRKLLEFASSMMPGPRLVLLDEPAGGVNPTLLEKIIDHIRTLRDSGVTFLIVEHNMDMVMKLSDSVVVMAHGAVLMQSDPATVQNDPTVLDAYLGKV